MKVIVAGDFCQKLRVYDAVKNRQFGELFDEVRPLLNTADIRIVNFEFPIVTSPNKANPIIKCGPSLQGTIEAVDAVKYAGFNVCTLANNHILDQGEICCVETKEILENAGVKTVGAGKNIDEASRILYLSSGSETLAIVNCCEHEFSIAKDTSAGANPLNPINQYYKIIEAKSKADYVLVIVHGGHEHFQLPSIRMTEIYRFFIDAGADVVLNHHQHCYSGYEVYKGRPIFYGLGNLLFDHVDKRKDIWNEGYIVSLDLCKGEKVTFSLHPYNQCDESGIGVHMKEGSTQFCHSMEQLSKIIADKEILSSSLESYYNSTCEFSLSRFLPFFGCKAFMRLASLLKLKPLVRRKQLLAILNYSECESHRDKMVYALKKGIHM